MTIREQRKIVCSLTASLLGLLACLDHDMFWLAVAIYLRLSAMED